MPGSSSAPKSAPTGGRGDNLLNDTRGLVAVEYILLLCLIAVVGVTTWRSFGETILRKVGLADGSIAAISSAGGGSWASSAGFRTDGSGSGASAIALPSSSDSLDGGGTDAGDAAAGILAEGGALGRGDSTGALAVARGVVDGAADVIGGAVEGVVAIGGGIWDAVTHPLDTAGAVAHAVTNPRETARAAYDAAATVVTGAVDAGSAMIDACASGDGYGCSRGLTNVVASVIPVGAAGTVARSAGAVRAGMNGTNRLSTVARRSDFGDDDTVRMPPRDPDATQVRPRPDPDATQVRPPATRNLDENTGDPAFRRARREVVGNDDPSDWIQRKANVGDTHGALGPQTIVPGRAMNTTTDRISYPSRTGDAYELGGHGSVDGTRLSGHRTQDVARQMVRDGEYRGGDVVLRACGAGSCPMPDNLRRDLNYELANQGHPGRVGTIAAPTENVNSWGTVRNGGHWKLFDE